MILLSVLFLNDQTNNEALLSLFYLDPRPKIQTIHFTVKYHPHNTLKISKVLEHIRSAPAKAECRGSYMKKCFWVLLSCALTMFTMAVFQKEMY